MVVSTSGSTTGPEDGIATVAAWKALIRCRSRDGRIWWSLARARTDVSPIPVTLAAVRNPTATATTSSSSSSSGGSAPPEPSR
ncbi:hypothetical protein ACWEOZ_27465 [Actinoplanes sp. NPDC004185]